MWGGKAERQSFKEEGFIGHTEKPVFIHEICPKVVESLNFWSVPVVSNKINDNQSDQSELAYGIH